MSGWLRCLVALLLLVAGLTGCRSGAEPADGPGDRPGRTAPGCVATVLAGERDPGCRGVRVRFPHSRFVPQGLALAGDGTAYISGYHWEPGYGQRECQVAHVDRGTGDVLAFGGVFRGSGGPEDYCRHGGGVALSPHGLWLAGAGRLWLLDPDQLGTGAEVLRIWTVDDAIRASTVASDGAELLIGYHREHRNGRLLRFTYADLLAPGATTLDASAGGVGVTPVSSRRVPSRIQGIAVSGAGEWLTRSTSYCGELVTPSGRRVPFLPGAEGLDFDDAGRLWVTSESGSRPYQRMGGRPDVPTLARIDPRRLDRRTEAVCW